MVRCMIPGCTAEEFKTDAGLCAHTLAAHASMVAAAAASARAYAATAAPGPSAADMQRQQQLMQQIQMQQQHAQQQQLQQYLDATAGVYASNPHKRSRHSLHAATPSAASISRSQSTAYARCLRSWSPVTVSIGRTRWKPSS